MDGYGALFSQLNPIPIHRRINEIMEEKGKPFTQEYLASRIGISRKTFQSVLAGKRPIYGTELKTLAEIFHMSLDRLIQKDSQSCLDELRLILDNFLFRNRVLELAEWYASVAIGRTERCDALTWLGTVQFRMDRFEMAHESWSRAFTCALEIKEKYGESDRFHGLIQNLMLSYTATRDYRNAEKMVSQLLPLLRQDSYSLGTLSYTLGAIARGNRDLELARIHLYESLHHFQESGNLRQIGRALHNVAFIEYDHQNHVTAIKYYEQALEVLHPYPEDKVYALKDYAKVYIKQNKLGKANRLIEASMDLLKTIDNPTLLSKVLLLHAYLHDDFLTAEQVLQMADVLPDQKRVACKILMELSKRNNDAVSFLRYHEMEREFSLNTRDLYDEEGL